MNNISNVKLITSLELVNQINIFRKEESKVELGHNDLLKVIRDEFEEEISMGNISHTPYIHPQNGQEYKMFELTTSQAKQVLVRESKVVRKAVILYIEKLESSKPKSNIEILCNAVLLAQQMITEKDEEIKKLSPRAEYTDKVLKSETTLTTTQVAKDLGITAIKLNEFLVEQKIQTKHREHYILLSKYQGKGYEKITTQLIVINNEATTKMQLEWTERGRAFIHYLYNSTLSFSKAPAILIQTNFYN